MSTTNHPAVLAEAKAILNDAAGLLETEGWTRGASARDNDGQACSAWNEQAVCYCLSGAVSRAAKNREASDAAIWLADIAIGMACRDEFGMYAQVFNDTECESAEDAIAVLRLAAIEYVDKANGQGYGFKKGVGLA